MPHFRKGDTVSTDKAPEPPNNLDLESVPMRGEVLATYGSQVLVDFGENGEHYMPKEWFMEVTKLREIIEGMWAHAKVTEAKSDRVEFDLYGAHYKVIEDPPGVTILSSSNTAKLIQEAITYVYEQD